MILNGYERGFINGAVAVLTEFRDASVVVHGPMGCYSQFIEATTLNQQFLYYTSSAMTDKDIIFGGEKSLRYELDAMKPSEAGKYRFVIGANASLLTGEDIHSILEKMNNESDKCKLIGITAKVGADHYQGINQTLLTLAQKFTKEGVKHQKCINLVGNIGGSIRWKSDLFSLRKILNFAGIKTNLIAIDLDPDVIASWSQASLTVKLLPEIGNELATYLQNSFDVPFVDLEQPIGIYGTTQWLMSIAEKLNVDITPALEQLNDVNNRFKVAAKSVYWGKRLNDLQKMRVGIVCEAGTAVPLYKFLKDEMEMKIVFIGFRSRPSFIPDRIDPFRIRLVEEIDRDRVKQEIQDNKVQCILGSSYELDMIKQIGGKFLHISSPNYHYVSINPRAYLGFEGTVNLVEDLLAMLV